MDVLVLADTHVDAGRVDGFVESIRSHLVEADAILHAGDIVDERLLTALARFAPVHAVAGNNDVDSDLPEVVEVELGGAPIAMIHDSGPAHGRAARLARRFPAAAVVVFGHSHLPWNDGVTVGANVQHQFNPGSPTQRRRAPVRTIGWLCIAADGTVACRHEDV